MERYDVFISYSVKNSDTAFQLVDCLEKYGLKCWIAPRNIRQGSDWAEEIDRAIENSENFVIIYSKETEESNQVPKEVVLASSAQKRMIPFKIDEADLSGIYKYYLSDCQIVDACKQITDKMEELAETLRQAKASLEQLKAEKKAEELRHKKKNQRKHIFLLGTAVTILIIFCFVLCFALTSDYRNYDPYAETIIFTANEEMTIRGFERDKELLKGRLEILFGEDFNTEEDAETFRLKVSVPLEEIAAYDVGVLLEDYLTIPGELYISNAEDELGDYLLIPRDEIEKVEVCYGNVSGLDLSEYGIEEQDSYSYIEVEVSNHLAETIKDKVQKWQGVYVLSDIELANQDNVIDEDVYIIMNRFYENEAAAVIEEGKKICFYLPNGNEKINYLMVHILEEEPMTQCFDYYYSVPTIWETKKDSCAYGKNQRAVENIIGTTIDVVYDLYDEGNGLTDGQWLDIRSDWKKRLDCLEIPYAFGISAKGKESITVRFPLDKVNGELLKLIPANDLSGYEVRLGGLPEQYGRTYKFTEFSYEKGSAGYYMAEMKTIDLQNEKILSNFTSERVELLIQTYFLGAEVPVLSGNATGGIICFDGSPLDQDGRLSKKSLPFLKMLTYIVNEAEEQSYHYNVRESKVVIRSMKDAKRMEKGEIQYGLTYEKVEKEYAELLNKIRENKELAEIVSLVSMQFNEDCTIMLNVKTGDLFAHNVTAYTRYLLQNCGLEEKKCIKIYYTEEADGERARIIYKRDEAVQDSVSLTCVFYGDRIDRHQEELQDEFARDEYLSDLGFRFELSLREGIEKY